MFRKLCQCFGVIISVFFSNVQAQDAFSLEDIFIHNKFAPRKLEQLKFIDAEHYIIQKNNYTNKTSVIKQHHLLNDNEEIIFDSKELQQRLGIQNALINDFEMIEKGVFIISLLSEQIYRYSRKAEVYFVNTTQNQWIKIADGKKVMYPTLSPDLSKMAYVLDNNIFIYHFKNQKTEQVTYDGLKNHIINGAADWVYEEEFLITNTIMWSDDSRQLAYLKFDESKVKEFSFDYYRNDYPVEFRYKYPRAGEEVSKVSAWIYKSKKQHVKVPVEGDYLPKMRWKDVSTLTLLTLNRSQNDMQVWNYNTLTRQKDLWYQETDKRYVELPDLFRIIGENILAVTSEKSGYNHLFFVDEEKNIEQITHGDFDIKDVLRIDLRDSIIVFSSFLPLPERQSVLIWDMKAQSVSYLTDTTGTSSVMMLGNGNFLEKFSNQQIRSKEAVKSLKTKISRILLEDVRAEDSVLVKKEFFWMPIDNYLLRAWKMLPPDFDSTQKYPVLFYVYGGPGSQTVLDEWGDSGDMWLNYMAQQGYIIVSVDNRGTAGRGADFEKMIYAKLGQYEAEDQIKAARYMASFPYVDFGKMSIFGWSYGGYVTLMSMMQKDSVFRGGISIAPVTDWRYYDAVYTERYMRTPVGNPAGYDKGSPVMQAERLRGELLLIHGTADDNVHYQHSLELVKKLVYYNKRFQLLTYPNGGHGIGGGRTLLQMYGTMTDFLMKIAREKKKEECASESEVEIPDTLD